MSNNLCIIPARGGSKRIPRKNIKEFLGKPIIAYSIELAIKSNLFNEVMVSTDDVDIAEISKQYGAVVPFFRSRENSDDQATTLDVIKEVIQFYANKNIKFDACCCIYPTAPLAKVTDLQNGHKKLLEEGKDSVFPVTPFSFPVWRGVRLRDNIPVPAWPEHVNSRSQDLETIYHDAGQWYWLRPDKVVDKIWTANSACIVLEPDRVQDIDTESDWKIAEMKYRMIHE